MARKSQTAAPARRNLTAKVRNQITELADEGKSIAHIANECGVSEAKVEATIAAAAQGKTLAEAEAAGTVATEADPETGDVTVTVAPEKPKKVSRVTRGDDYTNVGVRLFGIVAAEGADVTTQDLGPWGANDFAGAVDAYEAANPDGAFASYLGAPMRNVWHVASGK